MLTISKVLAILCLLCLCGNREYPSSFQNKSVRALLSNECLIYSVPGQTEGRRKAFLEWTSIDLYSKLSPTCGGNLTITKVFVILFLLIILFKTNQ